MIVGEKDNLFQFGTLLIFSSQLKQVVGNLDSK